MEFQKKVEDNLDTLPCKAIYHDDRNIVKIVGSLGNGVDHLLIFNEGIITIQDKQEKSKPKMYHVRHFIDATNHISKSVNMPILMAIFASKTEFTSGDNLCFIEENKKYISDIFYSIDAIHPDELIEKIMDMLHNKLYKLGIDKKIKANKIELYDHQKKVIDNFDFNTGVVCHPTGAGKTITALGMIGKFWRNDTYSNSSVLWLTQRKDVLHSQFSDDNKIIDCVNSGLLPSFEYFRYVKWFNKKFDADEINSCLVSDKPALFIVNIDCIKYDFRYTTLVDNIGMIILDESHSAGGDKIYTMLNYFKNECKSVECIIGFSATPIREDKVKKNRIISIFGEDDKKINYIDIIPITKAIDLGLIVSPKFLWIESTLDNDMVIRKKVNSESIEMILEHLHNVLSISNTKKGIAWSKSIKSAEWWKKIFDEYRYHELYPELSKYEYFISHSKIKDDELNRFMLCDKPALIFCVGRCKEGFDDSRIDFGINLDHVLERSKLMFIQQCGRALRKYEDKKEGYIVDTFTFCDEETKKKQIINLIMEYTLFILDGDSYTYEKILDSFEVKDGLIELKTEKGNLIEFNIVGSTLKKFDWKEMDEELREEIRRLYYPDGITYREAKKIIRDNNIKTKDEYALFCEIDKRLPKDPILYFGKGFCGWVNYLSIKDIFYDLKTCKNMCIKYMKHDPVIQKLCKMTGWHEACKRFCEKDERFPPIGLWSDYYSVPDVSNIFEIKSYDSREKLLF